MVRQKSKVTFTGRIIATLLQSSHVVWIFVGTKKVKSHLLGTGREMRKEGLVDFLMSSFYASSLKIVRMGGNDSDKW